MIRTRFVFWLDVLLLVALSLLEEPRFTSLGGHEWIGIVFAILVVIHVLMSWRWIVAAAARIGTRESRRTATSATLNGLLFIMIVVTVLSGLASSEIVLPLTGFAPSDLAVWQRIHNLLSQLTMGVVGLHIALNWNWIVRVARKSVLLRSTRGSAP